jgi:hypothetical protein
LSRSWTLLPKTPHGYDIALIAHHGKRNARIIRIIDASIIDQRGPSMTGRVPTWAREDWHPGQAVSVIESDRQAGVARPANRVVTAAPAGGAQKDDAEHDVGEAQQDGRGDDREAEDDDFTDHVQIHRCCSVNAAP